jgi:hypothetical protein
MENTQTETVPAVDEKTEFGAWLSVNETMPRRNLKVLILGSYVNGKRYRAIGKWTDGKSWDATYWDDCPEEWWDEDGNQALVPEGWWEYSVELEEIARLENVTHWMSLPEIPNAD